LRKDFTIWQRPSELLESRLGDSGVGEVQCVELNKPLDVLQAGIAYVRVVEVERFQP
jgi:hypothetical protein